MKDSVRIVLVGDSKVGKTSIIEVLITEKFQEDVQPVLPVLVVPKDVTPEHVLVSIVDTPGNPSEVDKVDSELRQGDVVVLVYAVDDEQSTQRVLTHWLPKLRGMSLNAPIILVGNKIDTRGGVTDPQAAANMERFIKPIMDQFREVDVCIECSAKTVSNISEVFYFAQKAVLYPTGQVYNVETHKLKPRAAAALKRIFKLCDHDGDGGLNDKELNEFQYTCFNVHLQPSELEGVKKVVRDACPETGINPDGSLSVEGFTYLHTLFVQKGRLETTWIVLRKFGYDDDMRLNLDASQIPKLSDGQSLELSAEGRAFLIKAFNAADKGKTGNISVSDVEKVVFGECPDGAFAFKDKEMPKRLSCTKQTVHEGTTMEMMDEAAFLARWAMYVQDSPEDALLTLQYMSFNEQLSTALRATKSRRRDRAARSVSRDVINVAVLGGTEGATVAADVVQGLVEKPASGKPQPGIAAARVVTDDNDVKKTVVMHAVSPDEQKSGLGDKVWMERFDVIMLALDARSDASVDRVLETWDEIETLKPGIKVPVIFVAEVGNGVGATANLARMDDFCNAHKVPTPTRVCTADGEFAALFEDVLGVAMYPEVACPDYYDSASGGGGSVASSALKLVVTAAVVGGVAYGAKRLYDYYINKPPTSTAAVAQ